MKDESPYEIRSATVTSSLGVVADWIFRDIAGQ